MTLACPLQLFAFQCFYYFLHCYYHMHLCIYETAPKIYIISSAGIWIIQIDKENTVSFRVKAESLILPCSISSFRKGASNSLSVTIPAWLQRWPASPHYFQPLYLILALLSIQHMSAGEISIKTLTLLAPHSSSPFSSQALKCFSALDYILTALWERSHWAHAQMTLRHPAGEWWRTRFQLAISWLPFCCCLLLSRLSRDGQ